ASKRLTTRKECYGYCQESKEAREEAGCKEARSEEIRSEKTRSEKSTGEEGRPEARSKAQAQRGVHEGDDPVVNAGRGSRQQSVAPHRSHQEDLGLHQEEQAAGLDQQATDQCRRQAATGLRRQAASVDVRNDQAGLEPPQIDHIDRLAAARQADTSCPIIRPAIASMAGR